MLLQQLTLQNLLSFGDEPCVVPLRPLNVLIGPNGSGKSNFIEAIGLLRASPKDIASPIRDGGGVAEWIWKGKPNLIAAVEAFAASETTLCLPVVLRHRMEFTARAQSLILARERVEVIKEEEVNLVEIGKPRRLFSLDDGLMDLMWEAVLATNQGEITLKVTDFDPNQSVLAQRKDPLQFPEITYLGEQYERIQIYQEWTFGRYAAPRMPQKTTQRNDRLSEDFSNLGMMLNRIRRESKLKQRLLEMLNQLYPNIDDFDVSVEGGTVQVFFQEGSFTIPATRLSDGTLRYLCLLVILLQPSPPPLVCIEEPELGLHPDVLPGLADLLREASQRMQLVVTTHSDILVDALSDTPEDIVICEKHDGATTMRRLESDKLKVWLEKYTLGQLWCSGELGGNRW